MKSQRHTFSNVDFEPFFSSIYLKGRLEDTEPKDLTPIQDVGDPGVNQSMEQLTSMTGSPETPGKKDRNSRKQCPYCNKGETGTDFLLS